MRPRKPILSLLLIGCLCAPFLSAEAQAQTPTFDFPLQEGNVWVYWDSDFPFCYDTGCLVIKLEVIDHRLSDGIGCGILKQTRTKGWYDPTNWRIIASIPDGQHEFVLCQSGNRIYEFKNLEDVPEEIGQFEERDMIADFDRPTDQSWLIEYNPESTENRYLLRRRLEEPGSLGGPYGYSEYTFMTYWAENPQDLEPYDRYYKSTGQSFTSGVGFPDYMISNLRGYFVNGVLTGDTATVWTTSIEAPDSRLPSAASLDAAYPNPFNPTTVVGYRLTVVSKTRLAVYDLLGREVAVLVDEVRAPGSYEHTFDAAGLPSGVYVVVLEAAGLRDRRSITLIR